MKFENEEPIADPLEAFKLLRRGWGDRTERTLHLRWHDRSVHVPFIQVAVFSSGYTKEEFTSAEFFKVTREVAEVIQRHRLLEGEKHWGWTDSTKLTLRDEYGMSDEKAAELFTEEKESSR